MRNQNEFIDKVEKCSKVVLFTQVGQTNAEAYKEIKGLMKGQWIIPVMDKPPAGRSGIVKYLKRII